MHTSGGHGVLVAVIGTCNMTVIPVWLLGVLQAHQLGIVLKIFCWGFCYHFLKAEPHLLCSRAWHWHLKCEGGHTAAPEALESLGATDRLQQVSNVTFGSSYYDFMVCAFSCYWVNLSLLPSLVCPGLGNYYSLSCSQWLWDS